MRGEAFDHGSREFRAGLRALSRHRPDLAVRSLRVATETCPAVLSDELSRRMYWLAIALLRLDRPEIALKSLATAQKLRPRGKARKVYLLRANDYGMPRRGKPEVDDFYAFYSIQTCAYLRRKRKAHFDDVGEKDAVVRLIADAWRALSRSGRLDGLDAMAKLAVFRELQIPFPSFAMGKSSSAAILEVDFRRRSLLGGGERCPCGSGLPYRQCCGRTASPREFPCE